MKSIFKNILVPILRLESKLVLRKYKPKVVAITGSVGKTSTKDAVYAVLASTARVRKSEKSYNSEIGLPLTVLGVPNGWNNPIVWLKNVIRGLELIFTKCDYPKWLVLEVGIGKPGDMKKTASWLKTDVVIMTAIGATPVHIEFFESRKHLIKEKSTLIKTLKPDGLLVLNADDEAVLGMKDLTKARKITYGFNEEAEVRAREDSIFYENKSTPKGVVYRIDEGNVSLPVVIEGVFGRNHIYASLASLSMILGLKMNIIPAIEAVKSYEVPQGRMRLLNGIKGSLIIDDTYNSSPIACESALRTLGDVKGKRKIAILGDMLELGKHTTEAHKSIGVLARDCADVLMVVGPRAKAIAEGAFEALMNPQNIFEFNNAKEAGEFIKTFVKKGDLVLIKGSQGMRMERTVEAILEDQAFKRKLLVRQDSEWLSR
jgi:UDP-N-acetylmuramoyl-tripeptide--D-alanyl-D-alanine ligase